MDADDPDLKRAQARFPRALAKLKPWEQQAFYAGQIVLDLGEGWRASAEVDPEDRVKSRVVCNSASSSRLSNQLAMSSGTTSATCGSASIRARVSGRK